MGTQDMIQGPRHAFAQDETGTHESEMRREEQGTTERQGIRGGQGTRKEKGREADSRAD